MEIDKKTALMVGVFGGIGFYSIPIFLKNLPSLPFKIAGGIIMIMGIVYFIAGDVIFGNSSSGTGYNKSIRKQLKEGLITPSQAFELQKKELEDQLVLEMKQYELTKQRAKIAKLKQINKPQSVNLGGTSNNKMPDVLGNLGPIISGGDNKPKKENNLKDLF